MKINIHTYIIWSIQATIDTTSFEEYRIELISGINR